MKEKRTEEGRRQNEEERIKNEGGIGRRTGEDGRRTENRKGNIKRTGKRNRKRKLS